MNKIDREYWRLFKWFLLMHMPYISIAIITLNIFLTILTAIFSSLIYYGYIVPKIYRETGKED